MILSVAPTTAAELTPQLLAAAVVLGYGVAASSVSPTSRVPAWALTLAWLLHGVWLAVDIAGVGRVPPGLRLGFGPVLSLAAWLILAVHAVESRFVPLPAVRRWLALFGAGTMLLAWAFPGELRELSSRWAPLHWVLGVASYGLFGAAVLHATMLDSAERQMRLRTTPGQGPLGMPLLRLERLTFRFVEAGFAVLTLAVILGMVTAAQWRLDHKTVFSLLGWAVFAALLAGRHLQGWRGQRATRWLYAGALLLLLGYVGSRFVFEVLLHRAAV
jgi:ABC-type uncharacterized transport system permease subunit